MTDERVGYHLQLWAIWMRGRIIDLGYPHDSCCGIIKGYASANETDFDSACESVDITCAEAVDAIVDGLPLPQKRAVYHRHLEAVYRTRSDVETHYAAALDAIGRGLTRRGIG